MCDKFLKENLYTGFSTKIKWKLCLPVLPIIIFILKENLPGKLLNAVNKHTELNMIIVQCVPRSMNFDLYSQTYFTYFSMSSISGTTLGIKIWTSFEIYINNSDLEF